MQIDTNKPYSSLGKASVNNPSLSSSLREGQMLNGRVTAVSSTGSGQNSYIVNINKQMVELSSNLILKQGQALALRVEQTTPKLILEILQQPNTGQAITKPVNNILRELVPQQQGLQHLTAAMLQLAGNNKLPRDIEQALQQLSQALPRVGDMQNPSKLAEAIRNSGLFMESTIAAGRNLPAGDLKLLWLSLLSSAAQHQQASETLPRATLDIKEMTPLPFAHGVGVQQRISARTDSQPVKSLDILLLRLFGLADSAVSRISLTQVTTAEAQQSGEARWKLEIPLMLPGQELCVAEFLIERETPDSGSEETPEAEAGWSVSLALDMPGLGPLMIRLSLKGEQLVARIHAEQTSTTQRITEHLDRLRARLTTQGLDVTRLSCHQGIPETLNKVDQGNMLDIRA